MGIAIAGIAGLLLGMAQAPATDSPQPHAYGTSPDPLVLKDGRACLEEIVTCFAVVAGEFDPEQRRIAITAMDDPDDVKHEDLRDSPGLDETMAMWPFALKLPLDDPEISGWLIGVASTKTVAAPQSGGQGARLRLHLLLAGRVGSISDALIDLPWQSSIDQLACQSEEDAARRLQVCNDRFTFDTSLALASGQRGVWLPDLVYTAVAGAYPQTARLWEDLDSDRQLGPEDLSFWRDPDCSYSRILRFNLATRRYEMDRPAPDCRAYSVHE